ncbi:MAG: AI-2E family transporter [Actinobacteria bacterium]|nr:AI-2E family transporter [Actinomycetota bacterium]
MAIKERIKKVTKRAAKPAQTPTDFGVAGVPINRSHPYYFGFVATLGALTAIVLMRALASVSQIFILILIALFLATGLNPAVEALRRRNMSRVTAVTIIFTSVIAFLLISAFGGVIGVGKSVLSGFFTFLTILVLTLYFITSLPQAVNLGLSLVPASRRTRIGHLTNAIIARVGSFVGSQIVIAAMASVFVFALSLVLGLPSPIAIGMIVFVCGLIPLVGHFLGSGIVTIIALTQSIAIGIIAFVAYVVYVQIENYVVTPRIMKRTLAVPGAVTIISALIGSSLLGLVGGLLAVPVAASIILILDEVVIPRANNS